MTDQEKIEQVLERFDFKKVHDYMENVGWTWYGSHGVPSLYELIKSARAKLQSLCEHDIISTGGGGLHAYKDQHGELHLHFCVSKADSYQ